MAFFRKGLIVLMVSLAAMAMVAHSMTMEDYPIDMGLVSVDRHGLVADSLEVAEEELMMESESARRQLAGRQKSTHIGYNALDPNKSPCNKRGLSYYKNCRGHQQANPYDRDCTKATRCKRNNH